GAVRRAVRLVAQPRLEADGGDLALGGVVAEWSDLDRQGRLDAEAFDDLLAQERPAEPLDQVERAGLDLVGAVDGDVELGCGAEIAQRDAEHAGALGGVLGGRDADDLQVADRDLVEHEFHRRARAEPDAHSGAEQVDGGAGGGVLAGSGWVGAHGAPLTAHDLRRRRDRGTSAPRRRGAAGRPGCRWRRTGRSPPHGAWTVRPPGRRWRRWS